MRKVIIKYFFYMLKLDKKLQMHLCHQCLKNKEEKNIMFCNNLKCNKGYCEKCISIIYVRIFFIIIFFRKKIMRI